MQRAAIVSPLRTPVGAFGGALRPVPVEELGAAVVRELLKRTEIDPARIEDVVFAQSYANGETPCVGRWIALQAGLPIAAPGLQLDRRCGGGLQAIATAAMMVQTGVADVVVAGGVESMSNVEYYTTDMRWGARAGTVKLFDRLERGRERSQPLERFGFISGMIETAENLARRYQIPREEADAFAVRSHQRAARGLGRRQVRRRGRAARRSAAQGRARDGLARRRRPPGRDRRDARPTEADHEGRHGDRGQRQPAERCGRRLPRRRRGPAEGARLEPLGYLVGWTAVGCEPAVMGIGPVPAVRKLFGKLNLTLDQMDLVEINEAFACQVLAVLKELRWGDLDRLNVNGSGISLGHPIAATGARIMTTLLHELKRRKGRYALETMCIGGGQGMAALFELA